MPKIIEAKLLAEGKKFSLIVSRFNDFISERLKITTPLTTPVSGLRPG